MPENFEHNSQSEISENVENEISPEQLALEKVVDIYSAKDLKYRTMSPLALINTLENGVTLATHKEVYEESTTAEKIKNAREVRKDIEKHRDNSKIENGDLATANVFYPEGILNIVNSLLHGELDKQTYLKKQNSSTVLGSILTFRDVCKKYEGTSLELCAPELVDKIVNYLLNKIYTPAQLDWYNIPFQTQEIQNEEKGAVISKFDSSFESIRKQWLKIFFEESQRPIRNLSSSKTDPLHRKPGSDYGTLIGGSYVPLMGVVFDEKAKVYINQPNPQGDDYPTEATLRELNNKRHMSGIFLNTAYVDLHRYTHDTEYADFIDDPGQFVGSPGHTSMPLEEYLKKARFQIKNPIWFVYDILKMIPETTRKQVQRKYDAVTKDKIEKLEKGDGYHCPDGYSDILWKECTEQERDSLQNFAHELLNEFSNIQEGQTFWEIIMNEAEKHNLPVYGIDGRLIWPKEIPHEEVEKIIADKVVK